MSISTLGTLFQFIGGLGMFLYGIDGGWSAEVCGQPFTTCA